MRYEKLTLYPYYGFVIPRPSFFNLSFGNMTDSMKKLNLMKDQKMVTPTDLINMKRVEEINFERVTRLKQIRKRNIFTAASLIFGVAGIYLYTIKAVKQEEFLDDFNEPEKISTD